jgi:NAD(P)H-dependent FMN reductase
MFAVISTSLNPHSRSRVLARYAVDVLAQSGNQPEWLDLAELKLPACDAGSCYGHPDVQRCAGVIRGAQAILLASPIYNYDVSGTAKNLVELTGKAWQGKVVGFLASAGGQGSYMSLMGLGNSLMLDFRCLMIPRFVFATEKGVVDNQIVDSEIERRIRELVSETIWLAKAAAERNAAQTSPAS